MAELGNARKCYIGAGYVWLAGEQTNNLNKTAEAIETSDKSTEWAQFISGKKGATAEVTVFTDDSSTSAQHDLQEALHQGSKVKVFIGALSSNTPSYGDAFEAIVTGISDTNDFGSVATRNISLTASGAVTHYPDAAGS